MSRNRRVTRRSFLRGAALATLAAPTVIGSRAFGANDRITTGIIGLGGPAGGGAGGTDLIAACDVRDDKLGRHARNDRVTKYRDFRKLLDRDDIDAVLVGTPDHWHAIPSIRAAEAGKDIYCEKPLTLTVREARAVSSAVSRYGVVFQTGSQQRSSHGFRFACEMVRSGRIGKVHTAHVNVWGPSSECYLPAEPTPKGVDWDMWLGPAPWRPFHSRILRGWRSWRDYSGGGMTDWGHHHFDIVQWALDKDESGPIEIHPPDGKEYRLLTYIYDVNGDRVRVTHGGASGAQIEFIGTEGRVMVDRGTLKTDPPDIMRDPIGPGEVRLYRSPSQKGNWVECIRTRQKPICHAEVGCRSVTVCHLGNLAYWLKRPLKWDPVKEDFIGDPEASRWLDRPKRAPWCI